ncbi:MAG: hypothetical protein GVY07_06335 [Bacteroidetes bacterium]|jgi:hypothetical protein|nr:hypothetical protein [Bacteroidota bacterium]
MKNLVIILTLFLLIAVADFSIPEIPAYSPDFANPDTLVQMERTVCYGTCPSYTLSILDDGKITFVGRDFVAYQGEVTGMMSQENLEELRNRIRQSHFMEIPANPTCESRYTDHSSVYLTIQLDDIKHSVNHYQGCKGFQFEEDLYRLEEAIDSLSGTERWIEGEE